jgi:hypothetical protein
VPRDESAREGGRWDTPTVPVESREHAAEPGAPVMSPFDPPRNRFVEGPELGRGGMGRVYEGIDRALGRTVAIKQVLATGDDVEARFVREVQITARLQHPGIVPVLDAGRDANGRPYYVMRKIEGRPLLELVADAPTIDARLALVPSVLAAVEAVAYAHARGVIHRDLKPANVLVGPFGETLVIDWGIAREVDAPSAPSGRPMGTPGFMPPEQARGEPLDRRADVYALGAMLFHALAGDRPFAALEPTRVIDVVAGDAAPPLGAIVDAVPRALVAIVAKAMQPDRDARYRDAGELAADLRRFTTGQLVAAHRYSIGERIARFVRARKLAVAIAGLAVAVLAIGGVLSLRRVLAERDRANHARAAEQVRADEQLVERAASIATRDPTRAIALLAQLAPASPAWDGAAAVAETAVKHGVARGVLAHPAMAFRGDLALARDGTIATVGNDGALLLLEPALREPARVLARLDDPHFVRWLDDQTLVVAVRGGLATVARRDGTLRRFALGEVRSLVVADGHVFADAGQHVVELPLDGAARDLGPSGGWYDRLAGATVVVDGNRVVMTPDHGAPAVVHHDAAHRPHAVAVRHDRKAFAIAVGDAVIEYELRETGATERARWSVAVDSLGYSGSMPVGIDRTAAIWLRAGRAPVREPRTPVYPVAALATAPDALYAASWDGSVWRIATSGTVRVGGQTDVIVRLAVDAKQLVGLSSQGVVLRWPLDRILPETIDAPTPITEIGIGTGALWFQHGLDLVTIDLRDRSTRTHDDTRRVCHGVHHELLRIGGRAARHVLRDVASQRDTPLPPADWLACAPDLTRLAFARAGRLEVRDVTALDRVVATAPITAASGAALAGNWLVVIEPVRPAWQLTRIDLATGARATTTVADARSVVIDASGRVAVARPLDVVIWDGGAQRSVNVVDARELRVNPAGFACILGDRSIAVIDERARLRLFHGGSAFAPSTAVAAPFATMPELDGTVSVIDLRTGARRLLPTVANHAALSPDGSIVAVSRIEQVQLWRWVAPREPQQLRAWIAGETNATIATESTRVAFPRGQR